MGSLLSRSKEGEVTGGGCLRRKSAMKYEREGFEGASTTHTIRPGSIASESRRGFLIIDNFKGIYQAVSRYNVFGWPYASGQNGG